MEPRPASSASARASRSERPPAAGPIARGIVVASVRANSADHHARRWSQAQRGGGAETAAPEPLPVGERDERLRSSAVLLPVLLVDRADAREVDRKRRVPVAHSRGVGEPRQLRRQACVDGETAHRRHRRDAERRRALDELVARPDGEVVELDLRARTGVELLRRPALRAISPGREGRHRRAVERDETGSPSRAPSPSSKGPRAAPGASGSRGR